MSLSSPTSIMLILCMMQHLSPINLSYRDCKHQQLDWFLAQALEIVYTQCSKSLDGYHLKIEDMHKCKLWFLKVEIVYLLHILLIALMSILLIIATAHYAMLKSVSLWNQCDIPHSGIVCDITPLQKFFFDITPVLSKAYVACYICFIVYSWAVGASWSKHL